MLNIVLNNSYMENDNNENRHVSCILVKKQKKQNKSKTKYKKYFFSDNFFIKKNK